MSRELVSYILSGGVVVSSLLLPPASTPVGRITLLSLTFLLVSGLIALVGSTYVGLTYLIVYVGAISLLFVLTVMMVHGGIDNTKVA